MPLDRDVYLGAIEQDTQLLLNAADANLGGIILACPGWTVQTVLVHLARLYRSVAEHVTTGATEMIRFTKTPSPDSFEVVSWFRESQAMVLDALGKADPSQPVWTWSDDKTVGFYQRRMAHETAMHRYDVEASAGTPTPFDGEIAADGIAELYEVVMPFNLARREVSLPAGSLHLHRADGEGEWMIKGVDGAIVVTHEHGQGDAAVRGTGSDLFVFAWHRAMPDTLQIFGDEAVARAWAALAP